MTIQSTRRSFVAAIPAAAVAVAVPASAITAPPDRRAWEHAMARLEAANREYDDYAANVHDPAYYAERTFEEAHGAIMRLPNGEWNRGYWDARRKLETEYGVAHRIPDHISDRTEALGTAASDAQEYAMQTPAPDLAALRWKLDQLPDPDGDMPAWTADFVRQTFADIARLLPPAA